jgi:hypothetical protein
MGRKLGATPRFGKLRSTRFIVVSGAAEVHLRRGMDDPTPRPPKATKKPGLTGPGFSERQCRLRRPANGTWQPKP